MNVFVFIAFSFSEIDVGTKGFLHSVDLLASPAIGSVFRQGAESSTHKEAMRCALAAMLGSGQIVESKARPL
jgi:hypothetical protein